MTPKTPQGSLPLHDWKLRLREDCELQGRVFAFIALGDSILQLLWERGLDPTVRAIVEGDAEPLARRRK